MIKSNLRILLISVLLVSMLAAPAIASSHMAEEPIEIYFFPGGSPGGTAASKVFKGAKKAEEILGDRVDVKYKWSDWNPQKMVNQFQEAVSANPDGIAIMGHPGVDALKPFVEEAEEKGIVVTSQNVELPELEEKYKSKGFGFVGMDLYSAGYTLGKESAERAGLEEGDKALVWGLKSEPTRGQLSRGAIKALEEKGVEVDYIEISSEVDKDPSAGIPIITGYLQSNPDCKLVITDHGALTATQEEYFKAAGLEPDEIYGAGLDLSKAHVRAIRSGYTDLTLDQQLYLQGFMPIMQIYLSAKYKFSGLHIKTGSGIVTQENIDLIAPLVEMEVR